MTPPALHLPDYTKLFILNCDASDLALGAALGQVQNGVWVPIACASRTLGRTEIGYSIYRKEALACVWGCERFKDILSDHPFILRSDNEALTQVLKPERKLGLYARWKLRLSQFDFVIERVRSSANLCADSLSQMFEPSNKTNFVLKEETSTNHINHPKEESCLILQAFPELFDNLSHHQRNDAKLGPIIQQLEPKTAVPNFLLKQGVLK